ncbi:MAG: tRNA (adenosine(37)-N6)-threonylcarbamoyltransferase complex dimerization subunit type 1 TsaB [bacterium]
MALLLGMDTASPVGLVFVGNEQKVIAAAHFGREAASRKIMTALDGVLKTASRTREQVDAVVVNPGPGSLTGIKVGLAFARTFCQVMRKPLIGVSSLDALAYSLSVSAHGVVASDTPPPVLVPLSRAIRGEVYYAFYSIPPPTRNSEPRSAVPVRVTPYQRAAAESLIAALESACAQAGKARTAPLIFGGDAAPEHARRLAKVGFVIGDALFPTPLAYLQCAFSSAGARLSKPGPRSWTSVKPIYLFPPPIATTRKRQRTE